jgi:LacI family transcriptional regulator
MKRPTQADVAELAGVSRATVSYVLSDRTGGRIPISESTRQRVLSAAKQLGYVPNALAQNLQSGSSRTIGFMIPGTHNPAYWDVVEGAEDRVTQEGYLLALVSSDRDPERERRDLKLLSERRLDGLILMTTYADKLIKEIERLYEGGRPVVFVAPIEGADWVYPDIGSGAAEIMDHLLDLGHERIAFISGAARPSLSQIREKVHRDKVEAAGLAFDPNLVRRCGYRIGDAYSEAQALLDLPKPPTAIWTINDLLAIGALRAVRERGLSVPDDIALAGFDDNDLAEHLYPPLTTARMPHRQIGFRAAELVFERLDNPERGLVQELLPLQLIVRQSTVGARAAAQHYCERQAAGCEQDLD